MTGVEIKERQPANSEPIDFFVNLKYSVGFWCELKLCKTRRRKDISVILTIITITGVMCDSMLTR